MRLINKSIRPRNASHRRCDSRSMHNVIAFLYCLHGHRLVSVSYEARSLSCRLPAYAAYVVILRTESAFSMEI